MHRDLLARAIRHFELRRALALRVGAEELQRVDELSVLELWKRWQRALTSEPDQLDATVCRVSQIIQQARVPLEERA